MSGRVKELLEAIKTGYFDVLLTFNRFNLLDQEASDELIPCAAEQDIGVVVGGVFYQGFLFRNSQGMTHESYANWRFASSFLKNASGPPWSG